MKTKIVTTVLVLIISCTVTLAQDKTKSGEKQSSSTKMEMNKDSGNSGCCINKDDKTKEMGTECGMKSEKETTKATGTKNEKKEGIKTYTCSMHPEVIEDKPGKCPKCGMALVEKD